MNILYAADDRCVPQVATSLYSVCVHNRDLPLSFYLFSRQISKKNKEMLTVFAASLGRDLHIIELKDFSSYWSVRFDETSWNDIASGRLLGLRLLPEKIRTVLCLDAGTLVRGSLRRLSEVDLTGYAAGAVMEPTITAKRRRSIGMRARDRYFNAGVLFINLDFWRKHDVADKVLAYYETYRSTIAVPEQDALNGVLAGKIRFLPLAFNYWNYYEYYPYRTLCRIAAPAPFISAIAYLHQTADPVIVHFSGEERPWRRGNRHMFRKEYLACLHRTPWENTPMEEGWELYYKAFYLFNRLMRPFPYLRYLIINTLISTFQRIRPKS